MIARRKKKKGLVVGGEQQTDFSWPRLQGAVVVQLPRLSGTRVWRRSRAPPVSGGKSGDGDVGYE